jgi:hypothetical protein
VQRDHAHFVEIPDVRDQDGRSSALLVSGSGGASSALVLPALMPYLAMASASGLRGGHRALLAQGLERGHDDVVAVDLEALNAACCRKALRPKPSVPSTL